ncbi:hypothetical protein [Streptacidiphilus sp. EB129]|jgi:hypothetical protein|uniref:hypothetical protein n=1 Tax=Streptacidiphilus sp. EB129 TaxID=3156262 RepID=UPI003517B937
MDHAIWPHRDFPLSLRLVRLEVGTTILINAGGRSDLLRVIKQIGPITWRVRPTTSVRPLDARYRIRQRNRRRRR